MSCKSLNRDLFACKFPINLKADDISVLCSQIWVSVATKWQKKLRCHVADDITFLSSERGFVNVKPAQKQNISAKLQENVVLRVEIEAYPPPRVLWSKDGAAIKGDKTIAPTQEHETK